MAKQWLITGSIVVLVWMAMFVFTARALDNNIDRQNIMLCDSATISGNTTWLDKCQAYYQTNDITYMRGIKK